MSGGGGSIFLGLVAWLIFIMTPWIIETTQVGMKLICVSLKFALKTIVTLRWPIVTQMWTTVSRPFALPFPWALHLLYFTLKGSRSVGYRCQNWGALHSCRHCSPTWQKILTAQSAHPGSRSNIIPGTWLMLRDRAGLIVARPVLFQLKLAQSIDKSAVYFTSYHILRL